MTQKTEQTEPKLARPVSSEFKSTHFALMNSRRGQPLQTANDNFASSAAGADADPLQQLARTLGYPPRDPISWWLP